MAASLSKQRLVERRFLEQLLDPKVLDNYAMSVPIKTDLRKYQQVGQNVCCCFVACLLAFWLVCRMVSTG